VGNGSNRLWYYFPPIGGMLDKTPPIGGKVSTLFYPNYDPVDYFFLSTDCLGIYFFVTINVNRAKSR